MPPVGLKFNLARSSSNSGTVNFRSEFIHLVSPSWIFSVGNGPSLLSLEFPTSQINREIHAQILRVFHKLHFFSD